MRENGYQHIIKNGAMGSKHQNENNENNDKKITFQDIGKGTTQTFSKNIGEAIDVINKLDSGVKEQQNNVKQI